MNEFKKTILKDIIDDILESEEYSNILYNHIEKYIEQNKITDEDLIDGLRDKMWSYFDEAITILLRN